MNETLSRAGRALAFLSINLWTGTMALMVVAIGVALALALSFTVIGGLFVLHQTVELCRGMGRLQLAHLHQAVGAEIVPAPPAPQGTGVLGRYLVPLRTAEGWKALAFWWIEPILAVVTFGLVFGLLGGGLVGVSLPILGRSFGGVAADLGLLGQIVAALVGLAAVAAGIALSTAVVQVHLGLARDLLSASRTAQLEARVSDLDAARAAAIEAAERERRRIERDLHDGTQQRLVALAVDLGMAKEKFATDPDAAERLVAEAHAEVKETMSELRSLTRGLRPSVLEDRGLDAALSAVVARCPIPVDVSVDLDERPPPSLESAAYFVVAEALTNVARHAEATRARVVVRREGPSLIVEVGDDGAGNARLVPGGGLQGLADRVAGFEGTLSVDSPAGGPTTIEVVLPCGS